MYKNSLLEIYLIIQNDHSFNKFNDNNYYIIQ